MIIYINLLTFYIEIIKEYKIKIFGRIIKINKI